MAHFLPRTLVNERLRLRGATSYHVVGSTGYGNRISSDRVVELLNRTRRGDIPPLSALPSDLVTAEEFAASPELVESAITPREIILWSSRKRDPIPHFRLTSHTRRFPRRAALEWLGRHFR